MVQFSSLAYGIGLGITALLRLAQGGIKLGSIFHVAENEIAGAVQNAVEAIDAVAGEPLLDGGDDRNTACHRGAIKQLTTMPPGQLFQRRTLLGNQFFVGRDHRLACRERQPHPVTSRIEPPGQLHDDVGIGGEDLVEVLRPEHGRRDPGNAFTIDSPVEDATKHYALWRMLTQDTGR
jgi:hypothetical protein